MCMCVVLSFHKKEYLIIFIYKIGKLIIGKFIEFFLYLSCH